MTSRIANTLTQTRGSRHILMKYDTNGREKARVIVWNYLFGMAVGIEKQWTTWPRKDLLGGPGYRRVFVPNQGQKHYWYLPKTIKGNLQRGGGSRVCQKRQVLSFRQKKIPDTGSPQGQEVIGIAIKKAGSDGVGWQWVKKLSLSAGLLHI